MAIINMFSSRYKTESKEINIPQDFRVQAIHIVNDLIMVYSQNEQLFYQLHKSVHIPHDYFCRESGRLRLNENYPIVIPQDFYCRETSSFNNLMCFMVDSDDNSEVLNILEFVFRFFHAFYARLPSNHSANEQIKDCFQELNERLSIHNIELQFENGSFIPIGTKGIYSEIIHPVLHFLTEHPNFQVAQKEIMDAFDHLRHGKYKAAISMAGNSVESNLKVICSLKGWDCPKNANLKELLKIIRDKNLIPKILDDHFSQLRQLLQNSSGTIRNEYGSHGGGTKNIEPTREITEYALHLSLSNINFHIRQTNI